uniref:Protein kinase domain-containing protein n=1 Tax=Davidia involucrata TaxID=16924 RepID=A0A5B7A7E4_DAVIN
MLTRVFLLTLTPMNLTLTLNYSFSLLLFSLLFSVVSVSSNEDEVRSLLEFKKGIQGDPLGRVDSWNQSNTDPNTCPKSFYGVTCDDAGYVAAIVLDRLGLVGDLKFFTLNGLKMLKNLSLSGNVFTGRLVPALGSMSSLQHLDLSGNQFYGPIPARINELWGLNYLNLSSNNFTNGFPSGIRNLQQLRVLDLHSNGLLGDIQDLFSELRNVEYVDLSYNFFYGSLSMDMQNISSLANTVQYVNLSHNRLGGGFFNDDSIQVFQNLKILDLGNNQINGELPSFGSLPNLRVLRLGNNELRGPIPEELLESSIPLEELDLSGNGFSGSIDGINSTTLSILNLSSNALSGSLPSSVGRCLIVDLSRNMLSDNISVILRWEATLEFLDLSSNNLSGSIPNLTSQFQRLTAINIKNNSLVGTLPPELGTSKLSVVDLSFNKLDGPIPRSFFTSMTLTNLNLSGNHFTGSIPLQGSHTSELLVLPSYPPMESLDLSSNSLTGTLASDIGNLGRLKSLNLAKNGLSGQIPNELSKLSGLEYLDLSNNKFKDTIPDKLPSSLKVFNVSYNDLSGPVPENLRNFPITSFQPGNDLLISPNGKPFRSSNPAEIQDRGKHHSSKSSIRVAIIVASVGAAVMIAFVLLAYYRAQLQDFRVRSGFGGQTTGRDIKLGRFSRPSLFKFHTNAEPPPTSLSFSNDHLLTSNSRSLSAQREFGTEIVEHVLPEGVAASSASMNPNVPDNHAVISGTKSSPGSPVSSSPRFIEAIEQSVTLDVYSPDRLAGELFFLDASLAFTAEELSRAPAEVLGRSSHGTLYKATLDSGHMLTVKWLRVGLVKHKKEFAKEVKKIGSMRHPNIVPLRAYYWGPREQERLILADYVQGDSLGLHLYETTPRRYSSLSFSQRLKVAVDVARCLMYLHERSLSHGSLKPTNILLAGSDLHACLTDYGLHRLMTPAGIAEQILNLGALGYRAPELATAAKPIPSFKADVYAFGVILMELLTRRSAGDIISGQSGAVDLTDWVRLCDQEGRGMDCIDRDIAGGEEPSKAMDELLAISLRCILPVNERPNIRQVFEDLCSISV